MVNVPVCMYTPISIHTTILDDQCLTTLSCFPVDLLPVPLIVVLFIGMGASAPLRFTRADRECENGK